jgi:hypothetical protein
MFEHAASRAITGITTPIRVTRDKLASYFSLARRINKAVDIYVDGPARKIFILEYGVAGATPKIVTERDFRRRPHRGKKFPA